MKRIYAITLVALGAAMTLSAQSKFDPAASLLLQNVEANREAAKLKSRSGAEIRTIAPQINPDDKFCVAVALNDASAIAEMQSHGYELVNTTGSVILCYLTPDQMAEVAALDAVRSISLGGEEQLHLYTARATTGVDEIHSGSAATGNHAYTGNGVITGMMDTGLQPNHVNFLDADGEPRIKRLWEIQGNSTQNFDTPSKIKAYTTDDSNATHATHVLGIMSGSFNGTPTNGGTSSQAGSMAIINPSNGKRLKTSIRPVPYYGVAKDAELAVCIGGLQGNNILIAAERLCDYAKEEGKPVVMNLSLGHNFGPHDGSTAQNKRLAELGNDMLICISAGNEGDYKMSYSKQFTASDKTVKTMLSTTSYASGYVDVWGDDSSVLTFTFIAVDKTDGSIKYQYKLDRNTQGVTTFLGGSSYKNYTNVTYVPDLDTYFGADAMLQISSNISADNNRYQVYCTVKDLYGGTRSNVVPGVIVEGRAGNGVNMYAGSNGIVQFHSNDLAGYVDGNPDASINDMACGDNVLVVGAYVNNKSFPVLNYTDWLGFNETQGNIASFSSYGKVYGGEQLPHVVGPGMGMISSYSRYYMAQINPNQTGTDYDYRVGDVFAGVDKQTKANLYDYYAEMSGTSMSSPFVAGVLALWLEADPTLTMDRVKEIIRKTADHDEFTAVTPERWGMGKINALAGLKEILGTGAVNTVMADDASQKLIIEPAGGKCYNVFVGGTDGFTANLYNMQGALTATASTSGNSTTIDASPLSDGIYLLEVQGKNIHTSRKFVVK